MKKKVLSIVFVAAIAVAGAWNFVQTQEESPLSDLALANVEALAQSEGGSGYGTLYGNIQGTSFCCCPGSNGCGASNCSGC
jgi:hypothetical protein